MNSALLASGRSDYETPPHIFNELDQVWHFTLDVCALPGNTKVARFFTPDDDGLAQDWGRDVCWMNPPYGREIGKWVRKAYESARRGATVVCLVPARTDARWWHDWAMRSEITFLRGRIVFVGAKHNAPFPCALLIFRPYPGGREVGA